MSNLNDVPKKRLLIPQFWRFRQVPVPGTGACPGETLTPPRAPL